MYFQIKFIQNVWTLPQSTLWGGCAACLALLASLRGGSGGGHALPSWQPTAGGCEVLGGGGGDTCAARCDGGGLAQGSSQELNLNCIWNKIFCCKLSE